MAPSATFTAKLAQMKRELGEARRAHPLEDQRNPATHLRRAMRGCLHAAVSASIAVTIAAGSPAARGGGAVLQAANTPTCGNATFPTELVGRQYFGMTSAGHVSGEAECRQRCCDAGEGRCNTWLLGAYRGDPAACFIGLEHSMPADNGKGWRGECLGCLVPPPPPPPPPPQIFQHVRRGSLPVVTVDLGSDTAWVASSECFESSPRRVVVPGGGFNSDLQPQPWIDGYQCRGSNVTYTRTLTLPPSLTAMVRAGDGVALVEFGGVAHGAEVTVTLGPGSSAPVVVGRHFGAMMPFAVDLTAALRRHVAGLPRRHGGADALDSVTIELAVVAFHFRALAGQVPAGFIYDEAWKWSAATDQPQWASRNALGITKFVRLAAYGAIAIAEIVTHSSVSNGTFGFDAVVVNYGPAAVNLGLTGSISPWNRTNAAAGASAMPAIPAVSVKLGPGKRTTVSVAGIPWALGPASFWWPNKPYREDYQPALFLLQLAVEIIPVERGLRHRAPPVATATRRFGFVEWGEAPGNGTWYTVNGRRINFISDATPEAAMSHYDCYTTSEAFSTVENAKETWRRFMRLGLSANRIHQSTPTQAMLDAADEVGFALQPETAIRGVCPVGPDGYSLPGGFVQSARELALACRGHPSVFSYSLMNECDPRSVPALLDNISAVDSDVPFVWNDDKLAQFTRATGRRQPAAHAYAMLHYRSLGCGAGRGASFAGGVCAPQPMLGGLGECAWCIEHGLESFAAVAIEARQHDIAYIAGWDLLNYWPNFLAGMNYSRHAWKQPACVSKDRVDGIDGWGSEVVRWVRQGFSPYLVYDVDAYARNPRWAASGWPTVTGPAVTAGDALVRELIMFNDVVTTAASNISLRWSARWGPSSATAPAVLRGTIGPLVIEAGHHARVNLTATAPRPPGPSVGKLWLLLEALDADGTVLYTEDRISVNITHA